MHIFQTMLSKKKYQTMKMILALETEASSQKMAPYNAGDMFT